MNCSSKTGRELHDQKRPAIVRNIAYQCLEEWPSGLRRTPGKRVGVKAPRGFESPFLRHLHPDLINPTIYVSDVCIGADIPRKKGPALLKSDMLVVNKHS